MHAVWLAVLPCIALLGLGMGLVVSPLSTAVMTSVEDGDTGVASGVNNAVARVAGLVAVALLGAIVASVFERRSGSAAELPIFFGMAAEGLSAEEEALRLARPMPPLRGRLCHRRAEPGFGSRLADAGAEALPVRGPSGTYSGSGLRRHRDRSRFAGHQVVDLRHGLGELGLILLRPAHCPWAA